MLDLRSKFGFGGLTGKVWHLPKLLLPELRHLNRFFLHCFSLGRHPLFTRMLHHLLQIIWVNGVENVKEIFSRWTLVLRVFVRKEGHHGRVLFELWIQVLHGHFIIVRHLDLLHSILPQQRLPAGQHIF